MAEEKKDGILDLLLKGEFGKAAGAAFGGIKDTVFDFGSNNKEALLWAGGGGVAAAALVSWIPFIGIPLAVPAFFIGALGGFAYQKGALTNVFNIQSGADKPKPGQIPEGPTGPTNG